VVPKTSTKYDPHVFAGAGLADCWLQELCYPKSDADSPSSWSESDTQAVVQNFNAAVGILMFEDRFLVPILGLFFGSHFWHRPNQFPFSGPKNGNRKMVPKLGPQFGILAHPEIDICSAKMRFAAELHCAVRARYVL